MAGTQTSPTSVILPRGSGSKHHRAMGDKGIAGIILIAIIGLIALFGIGTVAAAIDWSFLLGLMAMGIIGIAFIGTVFFKADFKLVIAAAVISLGIMFVLEVGFITLVGGALVILAGWNFNILKKQPLVFCLLVFTGLVTMFAGNILVLMPLGVFP